MSASKCLSLAYCFAGVAVLLGFTGCQSTGGAHGKDHFAGKTEQFNPDLPGSAHAKELRPVSNRGMVELLREANEAYDRAVAHLERNENEEASRDYHHVLSLMEQADFDPAKLYAPRKEFADELAREVHAEKRHHNGEVESPCIKVPAPLPYPVIQQLERIQNDLRDSFQAALDRGQRYMPEIRQRFHSAGLPEELCFVAMIESHFTEKIDSRAGAGGMWQFMPETGRRHNLMQDGYVDQRYDWQASTDAAIQYFSELRDMFDSNWGLAIASYNGGENGMQRAVDANGGDTEFFHLIETEPASNLIKQETKDYFPKFLAYWILSTHPEKFGFEIHQPQIEATEVVPVRGSYSFDDLEHAMNLSGGTLAKLNPTLVRQVTPPIGENRVKVPAGTSDKLMLALETVPQYGQGVRSHKVRKGETLASIASKYGLSTDQLKRENRLKDGRVKVGQTVKLPYAVPVNDTARGGGDDAAPLVTAKEEPAKKSTVSYTVKKGETYASIAEKNDIELSELLEQNGFSKKSQPKAGQKISITKSKPVEEAPAKQAKKETRKEETTEHVVAKGEYLTVIARQYGVAVADLETWNGIEHGETVREGQKLTIKKAGADRQAPEATKTASAKAKAAPAPQKKTVKVAPGDTANKIATKNGVTVKQLLAWNNLSEKSTLKAGQELVIVQDDAPTAASSEAESEPVRVASNVPVKSAAKTGKTAKAAPAPTTHTVAAGQTATSIAKKYNLGVPDLYKINKWSKDHVLRPGEKVVVEQK